MCRFGTFLLRFAHISMPVGGSAERNGPKWSSDFRILHTHCVSINETTLKTWLIDQDTTAHLNATTQGHCGHCVTTHTKAHVRINLHATLKSAATQRSSQPPAQSAMPPVLAETAHAWRPARAARAIFLSLVSTFLSVHQDASRFSSVCALRRIDVRMRTRCTGRSRSLRPRRSGDRW